MLLPCQVVRTARRVIYRVLSYNSWLKDFFATWERMERFSTAEAASVDAGADHGRRKCRSVPRKSERIESANSGSGAGIEMDPVVGEKK